MKGGNQGNAAFLMKAVQLTSPSTAKQAEGPQASAEPRLGGASVPAPVDVD